jgi:hypothetical protein
MSENVPFDENEKIKAMKDSIADRAFNLKIKGMLISGALMAAGVGLMIFAPGLLGPMLTPLVGLAAAAGGAIAGLFTMKEAKKLQMDEQYLSSYMQGKNNWGAGYREEVLERGYGDRIVTNGPQMGGIPGPSGDHARGHG